MAGDKTWVFLAGNPVVFQDPIHLIASCPSGTNRWGTDGPSFESQNAPWE